MLAEQLMIMKLSPKKDDRATIVDVEPLENMSSSNGQSTMVTVFESKVNFMVKSLLFRKPNVWFDILGKQDKGPRLGIVPRTQMLINFIQGIVEGSEKEDELEKTHTYDFLITKGVEDKTPMQNLRGRRCKVIDPMDCPQTIMCADEVKELPTTPFRIVILQIPQEAKSQTDGWARMISPINEGWRSETIRGNAYTKQARSEIRVTRIKGDWRTLIIIKVLTKVISRVSILSHADASKLSHAENAKNVFHGINKNKAKAQDGSSNPTRSLREILILK